VVTRRRPLPPLGRSPTPTPGSIRSSKSHAFYQQFICRFQYLPRGLFEQVVFPIAWLRPLPSSGREETSARSLNPWIATTSPNPFHKPRGTVARRPGSLGGLGPQIILPSRRKSMASLECSSSEARRLQTRRRIRRFGAQLANTSAAVAPSSPQDSGYGSLDDDRSLQWVVSRRRRLLSIDGLSVDGPAS